MATRTCPACGGDDAGTAGFYGNEASFTFDAQDRCDYCRSRAAGAGVAALLRRCRRQPREHEALDFDAGRLAVATRYLNLIAELDAALDLLWDARMRAVGDTAVRIEGAITLVDQARNRVHVEHSDWRRRPTAVVGPDWRPRAEPDARSALQHAKEALR